VGVANLLIDLHNSVGVLKGFADLHPFLQIRLEAISDRVALNSTSPILVEGIVPKESSEERRGGQVCSKGGQDSNATAVLEQRTVKGRETHVTSLERHLDKLAT
jgi:hypothetical protein